MAIKGICYVTFRVSDFSGVRKFAIRVMTKTRQGTLPWTYFLSDVRDMYAYQRNHTKRNVQCVPQMNI